MNEILTNIVWSLLPTVGIGLVFWVIMRSIIHADRNERKAYSRIEQDKRAQRNLPSA